MPIKGSCHCGNTQFEVSAAPSDVTRCTCSLCSKRGALWAYYTPAQFRLTSPSENVATYLWGSRTVKHHFCANCGCGMVGEPGQPSEFGRFIEDDGFPRWQQPWDEYRSRVETPCLPGREYTVPAWVKDWVL